MNPVKQALRTLVLVKGARPFVLIADDYQKDDKIHDYLWVANVPFGDQIRNVAFKKDKDDRTRLNVTSGDKTNP